MLAVSDTGIGMEPTVLEHAFEPFFTTKAVGKGSGLGLSMVYGLVKQSGGYINVYSEVNKGTTIRIYLPQAESESVASAETDTHEFPLLYGRGETVLVIEDDTPVRQLAVSMLNSLGYHPVEADSAKTALKVLEETPQVKLLFTDIVLPGGMNGTDLALQAQQLRPDLKVLFTSGYTEQALSNHRQFPEGAELLAKPYRKVNLAKKIHAMLGSN
jgi:CheY-like chemotaxis protein